MTNEELARFIKKAHTAYWQKDADNVLYNLLHVVTELAVARIDDASLVREVQLHVINAVDVPPESKVVELKKKEA